MPDLALPDQRHRLHAAVRVVRKSRLVVRRIDGLEVVEQQERIEMVEPTRPDAPTQMDTGAFDDGLGLDDGHDRTNRLTHE